MINEEILRKCNTLGDLDIEILNMLGNHIVDDTEAEEYINGICMFNNDYEKAIEEGCYTYTTTDNKYLTVYFDVLEEFLFWIMDSIDAEYLKIKYKGYKIKEL